MGIAHVESFGGYQFWTKEKFNRLDLWPLESASDNGSHVGIMMVAVRDRDQILEIERAWSWLFNTETGVGVVEGNVQQSKNWVRARRDDHPGLRNLTSVEHEKNALCIFRGGGYYYIWNGDAENPDWIRNYNAPYNGDNYAEEIMNWLGQP